MNLFDKIKDQTTTNYRKLFKESPAPMYIFDLHTLEFLAVNQAALSQYGYSREKFLSMRATDIRPPEERNAFQQTLQDIHEEGYSDYGRWQHQRSNGEIFYVHIYTHATRFRGRDARVVMALDINQKVKAERALVEKNTEITDILESITDGFYAVNHRWEVTYVNKAAEKKLNISREELLGKRLWDIFKNKGQEAMFYNEYQRAMTDRVSTNFEAYYPPLQMWASVRAYPTREGLAIYFEDITDRILAHEQITKSEGNLRATINNTRDIIWSIDTGWNIISGNEAFYQRMHKVTGIQKIERINSEDFKGTDQSMWTEHYNRGFSGETAKMIWQEMIDGKEVFQEVSFNPILDESKKVVGLSCISHDITENYLYTKRIEAQNEQLRKIAWTQSHEVRGPLSDILGLIPLIESIGLSGQKKELMDMLKTAAVKLDDVIKKITQETKPA